MSLKWTRLSWDAAAAVGDLVVVGDRVVFAVQDRARVDLGEPVENLSLWGSVENLSLGSSHASCCDQPKGPFLVVVQHAGEVVGDTGQAVVGADTDYSVYC